MLTTTKRSAKKSGAAYRIAAILICAALFPSWGCGRAINRAAERRVRDALPNVLGPARAYRVHIDSDPDRTLRGHFARVLIDGDQVQLKSGLYFDALHLELRGVDVDTGSGRVRSIKTTAFAATSSAATVNEYLVGESFSGGKLRHVRAAFAPEGVTLSAEREVVNVNPPLTGKNITLFAPFQLTGPVRVAGPRRLEIDAARLHVVGITLFGAPLNFLMRRFESGFDLNALPFPVTLTGVQTGQNTITLSGTADVSGLIRGRK